MMARVDEATHCSQAFQIRRAALEVERLDGGEVSVEGQVAREFLRLGARECQACEGISVECETGVKGGALKCYILQGCSVEAEGVFVDQSIESAGIRQEIKEEICMAADGDVTYGRFVEGIRMRETLAGCLVECYTPEAR